MQFRIDVFLVATLLAAQPVFARAPTPGKASVKTSSPANSPALSQKEESWFGKFDLIEKTSGRSVRFFARGAALSLFATGDFKTILLEGYYAKARISVGYRTINCPGGITGSCGKVDFVSIDVGNNF